jgi:hypothetical protein
MFALKNLCLQTPAQRRHGRRVLIASLAYAAALIPTVYVIKHGLVAGGWRMALALIPAVPMVAMFTSYARYLSEETDEYIRMMVVRQILMATTVAMVVAVVWGLLVDLGGAPPIATYWIAIVWVVAQGFSAMFDRARG